MLPASSVPSLLAGILLLLIISEVRKTLDFTGKGAHSGLYSGEREHVSQVIPPAVMPSDALALAPPRPAAATVTSGVSVGLVKVALPLAEQAAALGAHLLKPGDPTWTKCWFHSQIPHNQDRALFAKLGGQYRNCAPAAARTEPQTNSEALLCECVAPPDASAFGQHFLEIGANDGVVLSNLLFFELQLGWEGLCVEASPVIFPLLVRNRPRCHNYNRIITRAGAQTFFTLENRCGSWESMISCMLGSNSCPTREAALKMWDSYPSTVFHEDVVQGATLADIFAELGWTDFGWISVDVESAETMVFETIDWSAVRARFVSHEGENAEVSAMMAAAGYEKSDKLGVDSLFVPGPGAVTPRNAARSLLRKATTSVVASRTVG